MLAILCLAGWLGDAVASAAPDRVIVNEISVSWTDANGTPASTGASASVAVDATAPTIVSLHALPSGQSLASRGPLNPPVTGLQIRFSEAVQDPPGHGAPHDVTNPANYLLVMAGQGAMPSAQSCAAGASGADVRVPIAAVTWDAATYTATVQLQQPASNGAYRLLVCGGIRDLAGNALADAAGPGFDFVIAAVTQIPASDRLLLALLALLLGMWAVRAIRPSSGA